MSTISEPIRRSTKQRAAIAAYLSESSAFHSAQEIHAALRNRGHSVGLATVYRALQSLTEDESIDALRTSDGELRYRWCSSGHHHHLICRECGKTVEIAGPAVEIWADRVAQEHGFTQITHTVELFGTCDQHPE